jgi:hypothetical protein
MPVPSSTEAAYVHRHRRSSLAPQADSEIESLPVYLRFLIPVVLFCVAGFVWHYNDTHTSTKVMFPLLNLVPGLKGNLAAQVDASWKVLAGLGVATLLYCIVTWVQSFGRGGPSDTDADP